MKTYRVKPEEVERKWFVVDAEGKVLGRLKKMDQKKYYRHSNYPGGLKERSLRWMLENKPEEVLRLAVKRMLPKNRLGHRMLKKLKVYRGPSHPHTAQKPEPLEVEA